MGFPAPRNERGHTILARMKELLVPVLTGTAGEGIYLNLSYAVAGHQYGVSVRTQGTTIILSQASQFKGSPVLHVGPVWTYATVDEMASHIEDIAHSAGFHNGEVWLWCLTNPVKFLEGASNGPG